MTDTGEAAGLKQLRQAQVAVFFDFENLVLGAEHDPACQANPIPPAVITGLCRDYGNATVRRAYADWANSQFGRYQQNLAMNGIDLIQIARFGMTAKNAADIRIAVDAMEALIIHPDVEVFILVTGDGDYSPLVQRLREFGKWVVGVGTEAAASRRLVSVCSQYAYWGTLVAEVEPSARAAVSATFDIAAAEQLLRNAINESNAPTPTAASLKAKMLSIDPAFDERNYGCDSFRAFLARMSHVVTPAGTSGGDIRLTAVDNSRGRPDVDIVVATPAGESDPE